MPSAVVAKKSQSPEGLLTDDSKNLGKFKGNGCDREPVEGKLCFPSTG